VCYFITAGEVTKRIWLLPRRLGRLILKDLSRPCWRSISGRGLSAVPWVIDLGAKFLNRLAGYTRSQGWASSLDLWRVYASGSPDGGRRTRGKE
jgi:hypothetical protein